MPGQSSNDRHLNAIVGSAIWSFLCGHLNFCAGSTKTLILSKIRMIKL
jgi:hypothetical protein